MSSGDQVELVPDDEDEALPSVRADELHGRLKAFIDKGVHRSVFILGEPGTGKTSLMSYIGAKFGGLCLRIRLSKLEGVQPAGLIRVAQVLRPGTLSIDDIDRYVMGEEGRWNDKEGRSVENATPESAAMLDPLVYFAKLIPLVMASANFSKTITSALLRPGRFDELIHIDKLDDDLYRSLLPDAPDAIIQTLIDHKVPVAFIQELKKRVDVLGYEAASKEMTELVERSARLLLLNEQKSKPRKSSPYSLVGKSPLQRAAILERRATSTDKRVVEFSDRILRMKESSTKCREKAAAERAKNDAKNVKKTAAKKKTAKKKPSAKTVATKATSSNARVRRT